MSRKDREDEPGAIFQLFNRGVGKRNVTENRADVRYFLSRLAREHRRGRLKVHAYVFLTNHFHILAESPLGEASEAMRVIQNEYVRRFNRLRMRDGPLFRGRFGSRRVKSESYWWTLLRYIDLHSVKARISSHEGLYPFGSAYHYLRGEGPKWLTRDRVEGLLMEGTGLTKYDPALYGRLLARPLSRAEMELVELRMRGGGVESDPLDDLIAGGPSGVRQWMMNKAANADGTSPGIAVVSPAQLADAIAKHRSREPKWTVKSGRQTRDGWDLTLAALLREACGLSYPEVAMRLGVSVSCVQARVGVHRKLVRDSEEYGTRVAEVMNECLAAFRRPPALEPRPFGFEFR